MKKKSIRTVLITGNHLRHFEFLDIVKNLVDLHGGVIRASNNPNQKGANVEITFPKS